MMRMLLSRILVAMLCVVLAACQSYGFDKPARGTLIPSGSLHLTPRYNVAYMDIVMVAGVIALVYSVQDPAAPAWEILETRLPDQRVLYSLRMQRFHNGGEGEARQVLLRRVAELVREQGFRGYQITSYTESIDSRLMLPRRTAEAEILLQGPARQRLPEPVQILSQR